MWRQHSRSAAVSVAPGSMHAIAGLATHISTMLSNNAARTLVTATIIAFHHAIFENNGSVTGVTAWRDWGIVMRIRRYTGRTRKFGNFVSTESLACGCCGGPLLKRGWQGGATTWSWLTPLPRATIYAYVHDLSPTKSHG
jgi:hypothetical protein